MGLPRTPVPAPHPGSQINQTTMGWCEVHITGQTVLDVEFSKSASLLELKRQDAEPSALVLAPGT